MKRTWIAKGLALSVCLMGNPALAQGTAPSKAQAPAVNVLYVHYGNIEWQKVSPELGERSPDFAILHVDPVTKATQLMIRVPKDSHVPMHWHTANETHTVVNGTFIIECDGKRDALEELVFRQLRCPIERGDHEPQPIRSRFTRGPRGNPAPLGGIAARKCTGHRCFSIRGRVIFGGGGSTAPG